MRESEKRPIEEVLRHEKLKCLLNNKPITVTASTPLRETLSFLERDDSSGAVLVVEPSGSRNLLKGIFTERDYLRKIAGVDVDLSLPVSDFMSPDPRAASPDDTVDTALRLMTAGGYRHIPVVSEGRYLEGLVSTRDIILFLSEFFPTEVYNLPPHGQRDSTITSREGG